MEILAQNLDKEYSLGEIADKLNLNHGTCANIIKSMVERGYVESPGKKRGYRLGPRAYHLTNNYSNKNDLLRSAAAPMENLRIKLNESCILAILKDNLRMTLHKELCTHELQVNAREEKHAYLTATGRVLLAFMNPKEQEEFVHSYGLPKEMWPEVNNEKELLLELNKIREDRLAIHHADSDVIGVGVPVFRKDKAVASLGVYLPESRFKYNTQKLIFTELKKTAKIVSDALSSL